MELKLFQKGYEAKFENNFFTTPHRIKKSLFIPYNNSTKRSLFREEKESENISDPESDIGPMSPLAVTDHSSCGSSPERQFISSLATPEKLPVSVNNYKNLKNISTRNEYLEHISPSNSLKRIKSDNFYKKLINFSPKSRLHQFDKNKKLETTIKLNLIDETIVQNDIVPETPKKEFKTIGKNFDSEILQNEKVSEFKLTTPLGSVSKNIPIPKIYKRKSLVSSEFDISTSPEIKKCVLKKYSENSFFILNNKYQKVNDLTSVPKARAALFQDNKFLVDNEKQFTLNPTSFYGSNEKSFEFSGIEWREPQSDLRKRCNLPLYGIIQRRSLKKHKNGEINCGVGHGIKRPKAKRQRYLSKKLKVEKQNVYSNNQNISNENLNSQNIIIQNPNGKKIPLNEIDHNKKIFKHKHSNKTVFQINNNVKLKACIGDIKTTHVHKKSRLNKKLLDATDISNTIDKPLLDENKVVNILKILENDWTDDNTMQSIKTDSLEINNISPKSSHALLKNMTSPASELSNMASIMNIEDVSICKDDFREVNAETIKLTEISNSKFYPLFSKGFTSNIINKNNSKKRKRTTSWQLSSKNNIPNQYQIDVGQKSFGTNQCRDCGIIYYIGDPDDENAHLNYHNSFKILKFSGWKNERIIYEDTLNSSHITLVEPKDSSLHWKKVNQILEIVDNDLGLSDMKLSFYRDKKVYLYVQNKTILGVLVAEYIQQAFQMIPELIELNCCTSETTKVKCGINVVWTALSHRRQGIATKLVDVLRSNYYYGYIMSIEDIAFSTPTLSGKYFAEKYTKTCNFKVY